MKFFAAIAMVFLTSSAYAARTVHGRVQVDLPGYNAAYEAQIDETGKITGSLRGFGQGFGIIDLEKGATGWRGHYGAYSVETYSISETNTNIEIIIHLNPGGYHIFTFERDADGNLDVYGELENGYRFTTSLSTDGLDFCEDSPWFRFQTSRAGAVPVYRGTAGLFTRGYWLYSGQRIEATQRLELPFVASSDANLFVVLYILPYYLHY